MRIDIYLSENKGVSSRTKAKYLIEKGMVFVNGNVIRKPSFEITEKDDVNIVEKNVFASRGGEKLQRALSAFSYSVTEKTFVDVGASNGGFTHCLLQNGARKVYAVDVGENQLEDFLRNDDRVVVIDKTNARSLEKNMFGEQKLFIVSDLSFISLTLVLPVLSKISKEMLLLIKPQFECGRSALNKNGIVTESSKHYDAIMKIKECAKSLSLNMTKLTVARKEKGKNTEFMCLLSAGEEISNEYIFNLTKNIDKFYFPLV